MGSWKEKRDKFSNYGSGEGGTESDKGIGSWKDRYKRFANYGTDPNAESNEDRLRGATDDAARFGRDSRYKFGYLGEQADQQRAQLQRLASGEDSVSALQLRQSLQQNQANQQSMAAGARPANSAMAARQAMMNSSRMGAGLAGQQAQAGLVERQNAQQALSNMLLQQRQQELRASLGSQGQALGALGAPYAADVAHAQWKREQPSDFEKGLGYANTALTSYAMIPKSKS